MDIKNMLNAAKVEKESKKTHQLYTVWGEKLDPEHVLEEYPRPQLKRDNYAILNGYWNYAFTAAETPQPEKWDGRILVPFSPESALSGVNRQLQPEEALWYERKFMIADAGGEPVSEAEKVGIRTILHFGAVDQSCTVYVNGKNAGSHKGGFYNFCGA